MKTPHLPVRIAAACMALLLASCATVVTQNTLPDGTVVTVTAKSADPVAIKAALDATAMLAPMIDKMASK